MSRRVVITGIGIWSCLGTDIDAVRESLYQGKSGIGIDPQRLEYGYRSGLTGIVEKPVLTKKDLDRHTRAGLSEEAEYAFMASRQAFAQAGIDEVMKWDVFSGMTLRLNRLLNQLRLWKRSMILPCWVMD